MTVQNILWGAERIRGELLKLGIKLSKRTIQKIMRPYRKRPFNPGQNWKTFIRNHMAEIWACDFLTAYTIGFRQYYIFIIIALRTRKIVSWNITSNPTAEWLYRQLLQSTWNNPAPQYLITDRDSKYSVAFSLC